MRPDVITLRNFYEGPLGEAVADCIAARIARLWSDLAGLHLAGIGFATPLLARLGEDAASRAAFMPGQQGVIAWPDAARNAAALVEEDNLPLPDGAYDRVILAHALEVAENSRNLLREIWRILSPGGRLVAIVPRRSGFWAGLERTPFASGEPYSRGQLTQLLSNNLLPVAEMRTALYLPPIGGLVRPGLLRGADRLAGSLLPGLGGVVIVEAEKQVYRAVPTAAEPAARRLRPAVRPKLVPPVTPAPRLPARRPAR